MGMLRCASGSEGLRLPEGAIAVARWGTAAVAAGFSVSSGGGMVLAMTGTNYVFRLTTLNSTAKLRLILTYVNKPVGPCALAHSPNLALRPRVNHVCVDASCYRNRYARMPGLDEQRTSACDNFETESEERNNMD